MTDFNLKPDDPRVGTFNEDGSIKVYPKQTLFGQPFEWKNATIKRLTGNYFVAVGPQQDSPELNVTIGEVYVATPKFGKKDTE